MYRPFRALSSQRAFRRSSHRVENNGIPIDSLAPVVSLQPAGSNTGHVCLACACVSMYESMGAHARRTSRARAARVTRCSATGRLRHVRATRNPDSYWRTVAEIPFTSGLATLGSLRCVSRDRRTGTRTNAPSPVRYCVARRYARKEIHVDNCPLKTPLDTKQVWVEDVFTPSSDSDPWLDKPEDSEDSFIK